MSPKPKSVSLTVRLSPDEEQMLDATCDYVRRVGTTVLGAPTLTRGDALRQLAGLGYKRVQKAIRAEARAPAGEEDDDSEPSA